MITLRVSLRSVLGFTIHFANTINKHRQRHKKHAGCLFTLTNSDAPLSEERVHVVDICHELAVTEGEISYVSARLSSCQHLDQSWREKQDC